jgi:hypothetical protein
MLFRKLILLAGLTLATELHAATEFPGGLVPMDVVREFAGGTLYRSLPDGFPPISLPPGIDLRLLGSTSENYSQKVVLRTTLSREALYEQLRTVLTAQGWHDVGSSTFYSLLRFCHDQYGSLYATVNSSSGGGNRVDVTRSSFPSSSTCSEQQAQIAASTAWSDFYNARFPVLEVPAETITTSPSPYILRSGSSSGSAGRIEINRDGNIKVPLASAATVHEHFARQMASQGWKMDSSAAGERSATSVWIKTAAAPGLSNDLVEMLVTLAVVRGATDVYGIDVRFQSPPTESNGGSFSGLSTF